MENGCGTFADINQEALKAIQDLGCSHIWYTGVIDHASCESYPEANIEADPPEIIKGRAGSPYAIRDYYNVCPDLASDVNQRMSEFEDLVKRTKDQGLGVIIDHVPNHVARNYKSTRLTADIINLGAADNSSQAFSSENDFYYPSGDALRLPPEAYEQAALQAPDYQGQAYKEFPARATGNNQFHNAPTVNDWYETAKLNYGLSPDGQDYSSAEFQLWEKMKDILLFWAKKGIDGFRCDMAQMIPIRYWQWVIPLVKDTYPHIIFIAEIYEPHQYQAFLQAGFDYLYDKEGFYNSVRNIVTHKEPASALSRSWQESGEFTHRMLRFIENHDEQRIASDFFCGAAEMGVPAMAAALFMHCGPAMIYFGQELGEKGDDIEGYSGLDGRTSIFDYWGVKSMQNWRNEGRFNDALLNSAQLNLRNTYKEMLHLVNEERSLQYGHLFDLQYAQDESPDYFKRDCFTFIRHIENEACLVSLWFGKESRRQKVIFPQHLFDIVSFMNNEICIASLPEVNHTSERQIRHLAEGIEIDFEPHSYRIYRMTPKQDG